MRSRRRCTSTARRVAVFGGSFNPPHVAHVLAATYALSIAPIDEVLVVPVYEHAFGKKLAPFDDRFEMCRLALGWLPGVSVSDVERQLGGESLTLRTLEHLASANPSWALRLLVGADQLAVAHKWHAFDRVTAVAPLLVLGRAGAAAPGAPDPILPPTSSTAVRAALGAGDRELLAAHVPARVLAYIEARGLYREET
jgi:nicotinate-nucleotide adenylyltransferase